MPASAIWALARATAAPAALRFWHGTSTRPATGSHTSPMRLMSALPAASRHCSAEPPKSSTTAAAAMPAAEPTSA